jgi:hypothetical protein
MNYIHNLKECTSGICLQLDSLDVVLCTVYIFSFLYLFQILELAEEWKSYSCLVDGVENFGDFANRNGFAWNI